MDPVREGGEHVGLPQRTPRGGRGPRSPLRRAVNAWQTHHHPIAAAVGAVLVLLFALVVAPSAPATANPQESDDVEITIDDISPRVVDNGDNITFRGKITNHTSSPLTHITVWWRMRTPVLNSDSLSTWVNGDNDDVAPLTLARHDLDDDLRPGKTTSFTMVIEVDNSPFDYGSKPGARGVELIVTANDDDDRTVKDAERSTLIWHPSDDSEPTPLTVAVPLTPTKAEWRHALTQSTSAAKESSERLSGVGDALSRHRITWGLDVAVLVPAPVGHVGVLIADEDQPDSDDDDHVGPLSFQPNPAAASLVEELSSHTDDRPVISLGWGAPNYNMLSQAGEAGQELRERNSAYAAEVLQDAGLEVASETMWSLTPASSGVISTVDPQVTTLIAPPTPSQEAFVPPTVSHVMVRSASKDFVDLLLGKPDPQELLSHALVLAQDRGDVLVTLPASITVDQAQNVERNLSLLATTSWFELGPPTQTQGLDYASGATLAPSTQALDATELASLLSAFDRAEALSTISEQPDELLALFNATGYLAVSHVWAIDDDAPQTLSHSVEDIAHSPFLTVTQPATINLISQGGDLPISVENSSPLAFQPTVVVQPEDARLRADAPVEAVWPANHSSTVQVPITAVANGNVNTTVHLLDGHGEEIAAAQSFPARVRADWETTGTAVVAGVVAVGYLFGLIRNIRKSPKRVTQGRYE